MKSRIIFPRTPKQFIVSVLITGTIVFAGCGDTSAQNDGNNAGGSKNVAQKSNRLSDEEILTIVTDGVGVDKVTDLCYSSRTEAIQTGSWQQPFDEFTSGFDSTNTDRRVDGARVWNVIFHKVCSMSELFSEQDIEDATSY